MRPMPVDYLAGFPADARRRARALKAAGELERLLLERHPEPHTIRTNAELYAYAQQLKRDHLRSSPPLGKVRYSDRISTLHRALGLHTYAVRVQGDRLKRKHELRVASLFRELPADFLRMVVVHELAHLRHKDHDRAFYRLCEHIEPDYHRHEADLLLLLYARQQEEP